MKSIRELTREHKGKDCLHLSEDLYSCEVIGWLDSIKVMVITSRGFVHYLPVSCDIK